MHTRSANEATVQDNSGWAWINPKTNLMSGSISAAHKLPRSSGSAVGDNRMVLMDMLKVHYGRELSQVAFHRQLTGNPGALDRDACSRSYFPVSRS
jgi:hypothetical protein